MIERNQKTYMHIKTNKHEYQNQTNNKKKEIIHLLEQFQLLGFN